MILSIFGCDSNKNVSQEDKVICPDKIHQCPADTICAYDNKTLVCIRDAISCGDQQHFCYKGQICSEDKLSCAYPQIQSKSKDDSIDNALMFGILSGLL